MTPDEIFAKLLAALDHFEPILDHPSDTDLTRLQEAVARLILQIPYNETGGTHNLIRIIRAKPAYLKRYDEAFPKPKRVGDYDLEIDDDATAVVRARLEAAHKARRADRATFDTQVSATMSRTNCVVSRRVVSKVERSARRALCADSRRALTTAVAVLSISRS